MTGAGHLSERDHALLRALVSGSLRWHYRLAWVSGELVDQRQRRPDPLVAALVELGLLQLTELRIPDHAAVAATVDAAAELGLGRARGFVNAVLRRFLRERDAIVARAGTEWRFSHPGWLVDAIREDWPDAHEVVLDANNARAPLWLRVNPRRIDREAYLARLAAAELDAVAGGACSSAVLVRTPCRATDLPGFADGLVSVQDAAAQLAAALLDLEPGQRVLDACAAPGGKTAHMLEICAGLGEVVAVDRDPQRLERVGTELGRLGLEATLIAADATATGDWWDGRPFDRILLDAPCSGTGVIRRHPEIKLRRQPADVAAAVALQAALLESLWPLLAPGGRLVYATCSVLTCENAALVGRFAAAHADVRCAPLGSPGHFRIQTGAADMDGFYYACLNRVQGR